MKDKHVQFLLAVVCLALTSAATATTTWYVNGVSGSDSNSCTSATTACKTIGHAIFLAVSGDIIRVAGATYTENLNINKTLRIAGSGARTTIIDGGGAGSVATISGGIAVTLSGVTIRNGSAIGGGGGILNLGTLQLVASTISGNTAHNFCNRYKSCGSAGGGIVNQTGATLTISSSTIAGNQASTGCIQPCGGFASGGGIDNSGTLRIINSTITANGASGFSRAGGGGIFNRNPAIVKISNSTISGNGVTSGVPQGGDIYNGYLLTIQNSIVANSSNGGNCFGTMTSKGYNLSSDGTCDFTNTGDLNNTDPMLGPLQYNGGSTQTMALPSGSPAVDAGNPTGCTDASGHLLTTDQRGQPRHDPEDTSGCDIGAYERQSD